MTECVKFYHNHVTWLWRAVKNFSLRAFSTELLNTKLLNIIGMYLVISDVPGLFSRVPLVRYPCPRLYITGNIDDRSEFQSLVFWIMTEIVNIFVRASGTLKATKHGDEDTELLSRYTELESQCNDSLQQVMFVSHSVFFEEHRRNWL